MRYSIILTAALSMGLVSLIACHAGGRASASLTPVDYIDPMIGANTTAKDDSAGKTFSGAATPFGLVQLSPDTVTGGDNGSGYSSDHTTLEGFSFLHMSGVGWYGDFGNLQVMPETGDLITGRDEAKSPFQKKNEIAKAGYYNVLLDRYHVKTELTAAPHAGIIRFTFPQSKESRIKFDLYRRIGYDGGHSVAQYVKQVDAHTVEGWMDCNSSGGGWGNGDGHASYIVHFYLQLNVPIHALGTWDKDGGVLRTLTERKGTTEGFFIEFPTKQGQQVLVKSGISFVSMDGARKNLLHDIPGWDFDKVHAHAKGLWNHALENVQATGGTDRQKTIFYTALYHTMIDPRSACDVDGQFMGWDKKAHRANNFVDRTIFSGWDVYRAQFPLQTIINPSVVNDEVNSLMRVNEYGGCKGVPHWEIVGEDSGLMPGDAAVAVFAEAYLKGIRGYDVNKAYGLVRGVVLGPGDKSNRNGLSDWLNLGYVSGDLSNTLENSYDDYAAARFADVLGRQDDATRLYRSSENFRNVWDPSVQWMHARNADGSFTEWHGLTSFDNSGCAESNPLQQGWFVPHDEAALIALLGGKEAFSAKLNDFFAKTPSNFYWNAYCNQSNEPVHQTAYQFVYAGKPWLTQKWARFVATHAYGTGPMGIIGNEDVGQMSAWYVMSALGFYPACPADGVYIIGSPIFPKVTISLDSHYYKGKTFTVIARNNSDKNIYIQSATLNGKPFNRAWITHEEIVSGGILEFVMGPRPNTKWGIAALPPSLCTSGRLGKWFKLSMQPSGNAVLPGGTVKIPVSIVPMNGFHGSVKLSASSSASGVKASFDPSVVSTDHPQSILSVTTNGTTPVGVGTIAMTGASGRLTQSKELSLNIVAPAIANPANGVYLIESASASSLAIDDNSGSDNPLLWTADPGNPNQRFTLTSTGDGYYTIVNAGVNKALSDIGSATVSGAALGQESVVTDPRQQWAVTVSNGFYVITNRGAANLALDVTSDAGLNSHILLTTKSDAVGQQWILKSLR